MEACELVARRLQLHRRGGGRQIPNVGPIYDLDWSGRADEVLREQTPPKARERHVSARHPPLAAHLEELHVVDAHDALAVNVNQLLVEHIAHKENLALAPRELAQLEYVGVEPDALAVEPDDFGAREEDVAALVTRDYPCHRRVVFAEAHDHVLDGRYGDVIDRKSTRLNSSHSQISYAVFCLKKKKK